jgi:hypothetical protein
MKLTSLLEEFDHDEANTNLQLFAAFMKKHGFTSIKVPKGNNPTYEGQDLYLRSPVYKNGDDDFVMDVSIFAGNNRGDTKPAQTAKAAGFPFVYEIDVGANVNGALHTEADIEELGDQFLSTKLFQEKKVLEWLDYWVESVYKPYVQDKYELKGKQ